MADMQQTFLSSGAANAKNLNVPRGVSSGPIGIGNTVMGGALSDNNHGSSSGFDATQNTFNKRTTSVSKPVDRAIIEEMKTLVDATSTNDWQNRLKAIDQLEQFSKHKATVIKNSHASFINLMDAYCKLLTDNNTKVQMKAQQSFEVLLGMQEMGPLVNANLSMVVQSLAQNLTSTNSNVRNQGDRMLDLLEEVVVTESRGNTNALL